MAKLNIKKEPVKYWLDQIAREKEAHEGFRKKAKEASISARDDADTRQNSFNISWANTLITLCQASISFCSISE